MDIILAGVGSFGFIACVIWLIVSIRNWDSKVPPIICMALCLLMLFGGAEMMSDESDSSPASKTVSNVKADGEDAQEPEKNDEESSPDELLAFDERTQEDFKALYTSHNNLMSAMGAYADGQITALDFYNFCEETKEYFANASLSYDYGEDEDQKTYLSVFEAAALADQRVAEKLMKYLDTLKVSDLDKVQDEVEYAKEALTMIASNRGLLLVKAGLSDEEIHERVEADMAELEQ